MSSKSYNRPLEHKEYLKLKYLSQNDDKSKDNKKKVKKKKLVPNKSKQIRIFDDDIDLKNIESKGSDDELYFGTKEEKPVIAGIVDERPLHMRRKDIDFNLWRTVGFSGEEEVHNKNEKTTIIKSENNSSKTRKKKDLDKDLSPPRSGRTNTQVIRKRHDSDSDLSPERTTKEVDTSRHRNKSKNINQKDLSPPRHLQIKSETNSRRHDSYSDLSPQRKDLSVPQNDRTSAQIKRKRHDSDSDLSPERPSKESNRYRNRSKSKNNFEKDLSPPRHRLSKSDSRRRNSDSDLSPPRVIKTADDSTEDKKRELTLGGKKAGLNDAKHLREELMATKRKEQKLFETVSDEMLGKNAKTVFRDKSGKIRDLEEEARIQYQKDLIKDKIESERKAKYEEWSKGLIQTQNQKEKLESDLHEMSKPLARYEGDLDLDQMLKEKEREDDPMLQTIRKNKTKQQMREEGVKFRPEYKGPPPPMNRFALKPGYRWDGVDRSNGFEKKFFDRIANKESTLEEAYRWSTQDM